MHLAYKDLIVWQKAMGFAVKIVKLTSEIEDGRKHFRLFEQIESAAASIPQNIAEGKGRYSKKEFKHFLYIARGSAYEALTLIELFYLCNWIDQDSYNKLEMDGIEIASMLKGLIDSIK